MPDPVRILTSPLRVAGGLGFDQLAEVVAADALVRRAWAAGTHATWVAAAMTGDVASQFALERDLAREGHDRATLAPAELHARTAALEAERRATATAVLARLGVTFDVGAASVADPDVVLAARTAFVRLYEEGLVEEGERVVPSCPRCVTAVDATDVVASEVEGERLVLRLDEGIVVEVGAPELLAGAVAVAVPPGAGRTGTVVDVPLARRPVPVVEVDGLAAAEVLVPAHDERAHDIATRLGLGSVTVLAPDGTVAAEGPLHGLARYAAREAARELVRAEGVIVDTVAAPERVDRCAACGTVLVPVLGRHWFLRMGDLEVAAADAVRDGAVSITPADARDLLLAGAVAATWRCASGSVLGGIPVPAARCRDCTKVTVDVDPGSTCGKCMGELEPEAATLDARLLAAVWPLAAAGWPAATGAAAMVTRAVVAEADLVPWVLPALALGLHLTGTLPFTAITVHPPLAHGGDAEAFLAGSDDPRAMRLALVAGTPDAAAAHEAVAALDAAAGEHDVAEAVHAALAALDDGAPAQAGALLVAALAGGVVPESADRVRALTLPVLGA